ncbi:MAG TPA: 50S ribosomal protein L25 [Candidatus Binatia bacterium]|nr:50S ribosomal protein L25 [Candidatus Binatia bacterium]
MAKTTTSKNAEQTASLALHPRARVGTTGAHAERHAGRVPAVVYGHGSDPLSVSVEYRALDALLHGGRRNQLIEATVDGRTDTVLLREVQRDPVSRRVIHADFQRVSRTETIYATIGVVTLGVALGVKDFGGVLDVVTHELEIVGPADRVPEHLEVDVTELGLHDHIMAADIKLPEGFTMYTPANTIVVSVEPSRTEREAEEAAAAAVAPVEQAAVPTIDETETPPAEPS